MASRDTYEIESDRMRFNGNSCVDIYAALIDRYDQKQVKNHQEQLMQAGALDALARIIAMPLHTSDVGNNREFVGGKIITNMRQCVVMQLAHDLVQRLCYKSVLIQVLVLHLTTTANTH